METHGQDGTERTLGRYQNRPQRLDGGDVVGCSDEFLAERNESQQARRDGQVRGRFESAPEDHVPERERLVLSFQHRRRHYRDEGEDTD